MGFSELVLQLVLYGKVVVFWPILTECCQLISSPLATRPTNKQKVYHFTVAFDLCNCKRKTTKKCKRKKVALLPIHHFTPCDRVGFFFFFFVVFLRGGGVYWNHHVQLSVCLGLSRRSLLNHSVFCNQIWWDDASSSTRVACTHKIEMLSPRPVTVRAYIIKLWLFELYLFN